jgi:hypothetical protein
MTINQVIFKRLWILEDLRIGLPGSDLGPPRV